MIEIIWFLIYLHKTIRTKYFFFSFFKKNWGFIPPIRILSLEHQSMGFHVQFLTDIWKGHFCCRHSSSCSYSSASLVYSVNVILFITAKFCPFWTNFSFPWTPANTQTVYSSPSSHASVNILVSVCLFTKYSVQTASNSSDAGWVFLKLMGTGLGP